MDFHRFSFCVFWIWLVLWLSFLFFTVFAVFLSTYIFISYFVIFSYFRFNGLPIFLLLLLLCSFYALCLFRIIFAAVVFFCFSFSFLYLCFIVMVFFLSLAHTNVCFYSARIACSLSLLYHHHQQQYYFYCYLCFFEPIFSSISLYVCQHHANRIYFVSVRPPPSSVQPANSSTTFNLISAFQYVYLFYILVDFEFLIRRGRFEISLIACSFACYSFLILTHTHTFPIPFFDSFHLAIAHSRLCLSVSVFFGGVGTFARIYATFYFYASTKGLSFSISI